jgi:hypothetical protein
MHEQPEPTEEEEQATPSRVPEEEPERDPRTEDPDVRDPEEPVREE